MLGSGSAARKHSGSERAEPREKRTSITHIDLRFQMLMERPRGDVCSETKDGRRGRLPEEQRRSRDSNLAPSAADIDKNGGVDRRQRELTSGPLDIDSRTHMQAGFLLGLLMARRGLLGLARSYHASSKTDRIADHRRDDQHQNGQQCRSLAHAIWMLPPGSMLAPGLKDQHTVAVAEKPVTLLNSVAVSLKRKLYSRERSDQHQQTGLRQVEIGEHPIH
jgi:hypothetical protein